MATLPTNCSHCVNNAFRKSGKEAEFLDVPADQTPSTSLRDIDTVPVRGFLIRRILLSEVVYSFTVEEQLDHSCVWESGGIPSDYCASVRGPQKCVNSISTNKKCRLIILIKSVCYSTVDSCLTLGRRPSKEQPPTKVSCTVS